MIFHEYDDYRDWFCGELATILKETTRFKVQYCDYKGGEWLIFIGDGGAYCFSSPCRKHDAGLYFGPAYAYERCMYADEFSMTRYNVGDEAKAREYVRRQLKKFAADLALDRQIRREEGIPF